MQIRSAPCLVETIKILLYLLNEGVFFVLEMIIHKIEKKGTKVKI